MSPGNAELALGTAQFGLPYGIGGRGETVPEAEVRAILEFSAEAGIRRLDTAAAYGTIEARLGKLAAGLTFDIVSKIPALPTGLDAHDARRFVTQAMESSRRLLGVALHGMLFHRSDDLLAPHGDAVWAAAHEAAQRFDIDIGVSCYDAATAAAVCQRFPITMAQLPGSAFDQRLIAEADALQNVEVSLRSVFLQGLLLMPPAVAASRVPKARVSIENWHGWCTQQGLAPLVAALGMAKGLPAARYCIVGVDRIEQLQDIVSAWWNAPAIRAASLALPDLDIIDPRCWTVDS